MKTKIKSDKIIVDDKLFDGFLYFENGKITEVSNEDKDCGLFYDFSGKYVSAGFIDMHTHGAGGHAFTMSSPQEVALGCDFHLKHGTTSIVPTVSAGPFDVMEQAVDNICKAKHGKLSMSNIVGAHLEGPYLSAKQAGAQCPEFITKPIESQYKQLLEKYSDGITRWTYAPENDLGGSFCKYITSHGVVASAGHTDAKYDDIKVAMENGCNLITHLYSCTSTVTRNHGFRSLGVVESAFLCDDLYVEIIADGKHLPTDLVKMIIKIKGIDNVALITDSLEIAGTNVKSGCMSGTDFIVEDGVCKLKDRTAFAGSIATADRLVKVVCQCGYSIAQAVRMLTYVPAKILRLETKGRLMKGFDADIAVFNGDIEISNVFVGGNLIKTF